MDSLTSLYSSRTGKYIQKIPGGILILSFLLLYWAVICVSQEDALDLGRYYLSLEEKAQTSSIVEIFTMRMFGSNKYDFIYHIILFISVRLSIPLNLVTTSIIFIYFYSICYIMFRLCDKKIDLSVILIALLTTPLTWTVAISRSLTSIMFFTIALICFLKKKQALGVIFLVVTVFTHFSSILYLIIFFVAILFKDKKIKPPVVLAVLIISLVLSFAIPVSIREFMNLFLAEESGYTHYFLDSGYFFFLAESIHYGDKLPVFYALIYSVLLLFYNKKQGYSFWVLFLTTIMIFFFLNFGVMFVNRMMLLMPLVWGLNIALIYRNSSMNSISSLKLVSLMGFAPIVLHFYAYRETYFLF